MKQSSKAKRYTAEGETKQPPTVFALYLCCQDTNEEVANSSVYHYHKTYSQIFGDLWLIEFRLGQSAAPLPMLKYIADFPHVEDINFKQAGSGSLQ